MLDVRWLEGLITVAQMQSFTHAANRLNVSVSGLSRRIQGLESWAGTELIDRSGKRPSLTKAGALMLPVAMDIVRSLRSARRSLDELQSGPRKQIRITAPHTMSPVLFSWWLANVNEKLNSPNIAIESATLSECFNFLIDHETDIVACMVDVERKILDRACPDFSWRDLPAVAIAAETLIPVSAPLEGEAQLSLLKHQPTCSLGWVVEDHLVACELEISRISHTESSLAGGLKSMVEAGLGIAWLPRRMIHSELSCGSLVRALPEEHDIPMEVCLFRLPGKPAPLIKELWQMQESAALDLPEKLAS